MGCHFLLQGNLPNPGIKPGSSALQADSLPLSHQGSPSLFSMKMLLTCSLSPVGGGEGPSFRNFYKNLNGFTFLPFISLIRKTPTLLTQVSISHTPASEHWPEAAEEGGPCSGVLTCTCGSSPQATPRYFSTWLLLLKSACTYFPVS